MDQPKLKLDDDGFTLLGNALLLGYSKDIVDLRQLDPATKNDRRRIECQNASERVELRDVLELGGALGDWFYGPYDPRPGAGLERLDEYDARILIEVNANSPRAALLLKDIDFTPKHLFLFGLGEAIKAANPAEMRMPLALVGPTDLTRCARDMVISYFGSKRLDADSWLSDQLYKVSLYGDPAARIAVARLLHADHPSAQEEAATKKGKVSIRLNSTDAPEGQLFRRPTGSEEERPGEYDGRRLQELLDGLPGGAGRRAKEKEEAERKASLEPFVLRPAREALNVDGDPPAGLIPPVFADYERFIAAENTRCRWYRSMGYGLVDLVIAAAGEGACSALFDLGVGQGYHPARADIYGLGRGLVAKGKIIAVGKIGGRCAMVPADWFKFVPFEGTDMTLGVSDLAFIALKDIQAYAPVKEKGGRSSSLSGAWAGRRAAVTSLSQSASFHSSERAAPSNQQTKAASAVRGAYGLGEAQTSSHSSDSTSSRSLCATWMICSMNWVST